jgi:hypothetical protein
MAIGRPSVLRADQRITVATIAHTGAAAHYSRSVGRTRASGRDPLVSFEPIANNKDART